MSLLIRRIVFFIAAFMLPMQSWAGALASDCAMTISADAPAHCCEDSHNDSHHPLHGPVHASSTDNPSADQPSSDNPSPDKQATNECLSGADCHCSALYQQLIPFALIAPIRISADEFIETDKHFVAVTPSPLWRPPIVV